MVMVVSDNSPELNGHYRGRTSSMCRLVIGTPCSDRISNVAAAELDLRVVTHDDDVFSFPRRKEGRMGILLFCLSE